MTTTTKRSVIAVLLVVFAFVCCFTAVSASAAGEVAAFESFVTEKLANVTANDLFKSTESIENLHTAQDLYKAIPEEDRANVDTTVSLKYNELHSAAVEAFAIEAYLTSTVYYKLEKLYGNRILISDEAVILEYEARYNAITNADAKAWLNGQHFIGNFAKAKAAIAELKIKIQAAIDAIDNIAKFDTLNATQIVVLASEPSIDAAYDALYAIYNEDFLNETLKSEWAYVTNLDAYKAAVAALEAEYAKAAAVDQAIMEVYDVLNNEFWKNKADILAAKDAYDALALADTYSAQYNDLQSIVTKKAELDEMLLGLAAVEAQIDEVEIKIDAIGTVEYTTGCKVLIDDARTAYDALPADVQADDAAVSNYDVLVAAEEAYAALHAQFVEFCEAVDAAKEILETSGNVVTAYNYAQKLYTDLDANQKAAAEVALTEDATYTTYYALYEFVAARAREISAKVSPIIARIDALAKQPLAITDAYKNELYDIWAEYEALDDNLEKPAVTNSQTLKDLKEAFDTALAAAEEWLAAAEQISLPVALNALSKIDAAEDLFVELDAAVQTFIANLANEIEEPWMSYEAAYEVYATAIAQRNALIAQVETIATAMGNIDNTNVELSEVGNWVATVDPIIIAYEALEEASKEYLQVKYADEYANYMAALNNIAKYSVEYYIETLPAVVTYDDLAQVEAVRDAVNAYIDLVGEEEATDKAYMDTTYIRNYQKLLDAEAAIGLELGVLTQWMNNVVGLVGGDFANIAKITLDEDALAVDYAKAIALKDEYATFTAKEQEYIATKGEYYAKLLEIIAAAEAKAQAVEDDMKAIVDKAALEGLEESDVEVIEAIEEAYKGLHDSQKDLIDSNVLNAFTDILDKWVFATYFENIIDGLYDTVVGPNADITSDTPIILGLVKNLYNELDDDQKALIGNYNKVAEIEAAYNAAVEAGKVVNVTDLKAAFEAFKAEFLEGAEIANSKIAELEAAIEALEAELAAGEEASAALAGTVNTLTIVIIILGVLSLASVAGVVVLFVKKK